MSTKLQKEHEKKTLHKTIIRDFCYFHIHTHIWICGQLRGSGLNHILSFEAGISLRFFHAQSEIRESMAFSQKGIFINKGKSKLQITHNTY